MSGADKASDLQCMTPVNLSPWPVSLQDSLCIAAVPPELFSRCVGEIPALCVFVLGLPGGRGVMRGREPTEVFKMFLFLLFS